MRVGCQRNAVIGGLLLLSSLLFAGWFPQTSGVTTDLYAVNFPVDQNTGWAVGFGGTIVKTTDGGNTWAPQTSGTSALLRSVSFVDNSTGFAVGYDTQAVALKTTDGGSTWSPMSVGTTGSLFQVQLVTATTGYLVYDARGNSAVRKTTDGGGSWVDQSLPGMSKHVRCLYFTSENTGFVAGQGSYLVRTTDGGANYTPLGAGQGGKDFLAIAFRPGDPTVGFVAGNDTAHRNTIFETYNGGDTWITRYPPRAQDWNGLAIPTGGSGVFAAGDSGMLARYVEGHGWVNQATGVTITLTGLSFPADSMTGYVVGYAGVILKTTDGGGPGVEEVKSPGARLTGIRVVSNPCRRGIALYSDAGVNVVAFDAAGRAVMSRAVASGTSFLPLRAGAYFVKAGAQTVRAVVTD